MQVTRGSMAFARLLTHRPLPSLVRRRCTVTANCHAHVFASLTSYCRRVHERPFVEPPSSSDGASHGEAFETARDALLQLNLMVRRGIEPDALMYTSLIATMGRARLEWQAYKLFSRMLECGVRPLPETYVALRDATSPTRRNLRRDLEQKIAESLETFPEELAEAELQLQRERDRECVKKFEEYMNGVLPPTSAPSNRQETSALVADSICEEGQTSPPTNEGLKGEGLVNKKGGPVATMHIRNPTDAWSTARMMEQQLQCRSRQAHGEAAASLAEQLNRLHEEELRIFLAAQKQLRHGSKEELLQRVLHRVSEQSIRNMLARRKHYFQSVAQILENDLNVLRSEGLINKQLGNCAVTSEEGQTISSTAVRTSSDLRVSNNRGSDDNSATRPTEVNFPAVDRTLREREKQTVVPECLYTPWGILRKPVRVPSAEETPRSIERLQRLSLTVDELQMVRNKAVSGGLDELPESLLRRYAYQFSLKWKRQHPLSLLEAVEWHSTTLLTQKLDGTDVLPTPALRLQQEREGVHKTLENYEAFRIISQRTNNLQVVDNKEINLHLKAVRREALRRERRAEETLRRERNLLDAAALAASAKTFTASDAESTASSHVLGLDEGCDSNDRIDNEIAALDSTQEESNEEEKQREEASELPPWAICSGEEEFDITSGRFGDPALGRYQELSDGRFKILPSSEAQRRWVVDRGLLPSALQDTLRRAELQQKSREEEIERRYQEKLQFKRYRKWDAFLRKAQNKRKPVESGDEEGDGGNGACKPLSPKKRLSLLLRKGRDKAPVDDVIRAKYSKTL
uniref:Uncharacterized protein n=1 Tax=Trypanosoma congolense (strain IL3000) TaxID=1068625 RepID=G0URT9_TRYCI|nr:conserved hypothetical protein [Trypanosoma congolense IL3000]